MTEFRIKVYKQNRILLSIFIISVAIPFCLFLSTEIERTFLKVIFLILTLAIITTLLYYFSFGLLKVTSSDNQLNFRWNKKPIFNFKEYNSIEFDNIKSIIVEEGMYLRKIKTQDTEIELGGLKSKNTDSLKLLTLLKTKTSIKVKDSWDVWNERGWLTIAYRINLLILIVATGIVITFIVLKGFDSKLLFLPLVLSQLIFSHLQMKDKLK